ncbi:MAG: MATE family efflux transporter [Lachnospiraceae bacterium]|nr:MATE family efflux transporter [Lachnospiraceae bacterium]MBQ3980348.1 MATE family efflux transporter [Lachnospiraceae bacterium]
MNARSSKNYNIDMSTGSLPRKMLLFALPLIFSSILQLLFNAADLIVVGRCVGDEALAAVGSTGALINLLTNLFLGLSVGANVLVARYTGANREKDVEETVHTAVLVSIVSGALLAAVGFTYARPLLALMDTPTDVIGGAAHYMRIYFLGMPIMMLYNFGSAILRAIGDTRRPLAYLAIAGAVNVGLNLCFVLIFGMGVEGVAYATVISQLISAILVVNNLAHQDNACRFHFSKLRIHAKKLAGIARIGLPAGLQGCIFSISNVLIQSSINSFGKLAVSGNSAGVNIEGFIYVSMNAWHHTTLSFVGQNYGAGRFDRIRKSLRWGLLFVFLFGFGLDAIALLLKPHLIGIYTKDPEAIAYGCARIGVICLMYFTCGIMDVIVGALRGIGFSLLPTLTSLLGVCGFRITWIYTYFRSHRSLKVLYASYPISWCITIVLHGIVYLAWLYKNRAKCAANATEPVTPASSD